MRARGKVIVVTGAGSGMGREMTLLLLARGAKVAAVDVSDPGLKETVALAGAAAELATFRLDVTDKEGVEALPRLVMDRFGAVDGLINNAGIIQPMLPVSRLPPAVIERVMAVDFFGVLGLTRAFLPFLEGRPEAHIVNVSSMGGFLPVPGQTVYGASKAAVKLLSEGLWAELAGSGVRVTVAFPGAVETNILEHSGLGSYAEQREKWTKAGKGRMPPVLPASEAARRIVDGMERNAFRVLVGRDAWLLDLLYRLFPRRAAKLIQKQMQQILSL